MHLDSFILGFPRPDMIDENNRSDNYVNCKLELQSRAQSNGETFAYLWLYSVITNEADLTTRVVLA